MARELWLGIVIAAFLVACGASTPAVQPTPPEQLSGYPEPGESQPDGYPGQPTVATALDQTPMAPLEAPETASGTASISGIALARSGVLVAETTFFLTPGQGANQEYPPDYVPDPDQARGDVVGRTDSAGRFEVTNIPPGRYFLFFWGQYGWREAEVSVEDQGPLAIELQADARQPLGVVTVSWP